MYDSGIFIFGTEIFHAGVKKDPISCLPLELSWLIFSYLDDTALRCANHASKMWKRIIMANRKLRDRLNKFELSIIMGSKNIVRFTSRHKSKPNKKKKNYLQSGECAVRPTKAAHHKSKRSGDELILYTKRFKLF
ncbi:hypothetical protein evm_001068 [Chilo suppressalis]|nr:hypothetical protein evm_001068 [Chilo suppressalis]